MGASSVGLHSSQVFTTRGKYLKKVLLRNEGGSFGLMCLEVQSPRMGGPIGLVSGEFGGWQWLDMC